MRTELVLVLLLLIGGGLGLLSWWLRKSAFAALALSLLPTVGLVLSFTYC